ncbi:hypothetical protein DFH28DRAFT_852320, partial [Melampsora americana]
RETISICQRLEDHKPRISPKEFIHAFLSTDNPVLNVKRCLWASETKGSKSTLDIVRDIKNLLNFSGPDGKEIWRKFILDE